MLVSDKSSLYVGESDFQYNIGGIGAAISLRRESTLTALDSNFSHNTATQQAAVLAVD